MSKTLKSCALAGLCLISGLAQAQVFTVDPKDYFAFSKPYSGGVQSLLSHQRCPLKVTGLDDELKSRYAVDEKKSDKKWYRATIYVPQIHTAGPGCWINVVDTKFRDSDPALLVCQQLEKGIGNCTKIDQSYFMDISELPVRHEPTRPRW